MDRKLYVFAGIVIVLLAILIVLRFTDKTGRKPYQADVSGVEIEPIQISRFEKVLFNINPFQIHEELEPHIDEFYFFLGDEIDNPMAQRQLFDYITDPVIIELYNETDKVFSELTELENELTNAFKYYKYYFPDNEIPKVFSYVSGLDIFYPIKQTDNNIAIALDMYLGRDYAKYRRVGIPAYQLMMRSQEFIVRDVMHEIAESMVGKNIKPESLVDFMIYEGMKLYFLDCMLPHVHDTLKIGYNSRQEYWMKRNKGHVWSYFVDNQLFYSTNRHNINSFLIEAPFTSPFTHNSAPRVAVWLGWQIVREYMNRNRDVELSDLIEIANAEEIFVKSRYKP